MTVLAAGITVCVFIVLAVSVAAYQEGRKTRELRRKVRDERRGMA